MPDEEREKREEVSPRTLDHVRLITEKQLEDAARRQKDSGKTLWDILMSDLSLKSLRELLTYEIGTKGRSLKEVMLEEGLATEEELGGLLSAEAPSGLQLGEVLIDKGLITRAQLGQALIEQERTGHPLGRVLMNLGMVSAKQLSDALRIEKPSVPVKLRREQLVDTLLRNKTIEHEALMDLVRQSEDAGQDLADLIVESGVLSATQLGRLMEKELGFPYINLSEYDVDESVVHLVPESVIRSRLILPVRREGKALVVAMEDPNDISAIDDISMLTGFNVRPVLAWQKQLVAKINELLGEASPNMPVAGPTPLSRPRQGREPVLPSARHERLDELVESVSVVNLVASIVEGAINSDATDVHLEPQANDMRVRYRIDGMLYDVMAIPRNIEQGLVSRIKILGDMDITQRRLPQDGHFSMEIRERNYDMRIATLPTTLGERVVIRLLNPGNVMLGLKQLGFSEEDFSMVESLIHEPHGMFLVTGPMGSGKTTTLYAALNQINVLTDSIVTIEDPVEYQLPGISQVQIDPKIDRTFAHVLRAVLRQDANTLLVGEIRDSETAAIAARAAVTGHLVFSTLHTRNTVSAITALVNLGVPSFLVTSSLVGIVNQRLVRRICPYCLEEYQPGEALLRGLGVSENLPEGTTFAKGVGCPSCYHTGYRGRTGIFEILILNNELRELILDKASEESVKRAAVAGGMRTLYDDALLKLTHKITSAEEVSRTVHVER